jgi:RNA polymerase-binding protein DksA
MDTMTQTHLVTLRNLLTYRLRELQAEVRAEHDASLRQEGASGEVADLKDAASREQLAAVDDAETARDEGELAAVEAALRRLDANAYGDCIDCGEPIPLQRLLVQPSAARCAACQSAFEHAATKAA